MTQLRSTPFRGNPEAVRMSATAQGRRGVGLVEILISIVVVTLLVAITVPSASKYAKTSRQASLQQTTRDIADGLDAEFLRMKGYPATAAYYATAHPEIPRIKPSGVQWGVFSTTADARGALVKVTDASDPTNQCTLGIGTLVNSGLVCSNVSQ